MRRSVKFIAVLVLAAGTFGVSPSSPITANVPAGGTLYVLAGTCSANADGSVSAPFCTISAAAAAAQPGDTVEIESGNYHENVAITKSGTPSAPITFTGLTGNIVRVFATTSATPAIALNGVHDIVVRDLVVFGSSGAPAVQIDDSTDITLDQGTIHPGTATVGVEVGGSSNTITVSRLFAETPNVTGIAVNGATNVTLAGDEVYTTKAGTKAMAINDSPGVNVTNNSVVASCGTGISLSGNSSGSSLENNIVETGSGSPWSPAACAAPNTAVSVAVSNSSTSGTIANYNLIDPISGGPLYAWGSTNYTDLATFRADTGRGARDIASAPQLGHLIGGDNAYFAVAGTSPAVDSGDEQARGALSTDLLDNSHADDPNVANTGTGDGYADRGAIDVSGVVTTGGGQLVRKPGGGPTEVLGTTVNSQLWTVDGPWGFNRFQAAGQFPTILRSGVTFDYVSHKAGSVCVNAFASTDGFRTVNGGGGTSCTVVGAYYNPLPPVRILDTRSAIGVTTRTPVPAHSDVAIPISAFSPIATSDVVAVVMNVTATSATQSGWIAAYSGDTYPGVSNLNFAANTTVPNLVTVPVVDSMIHFYNGSSGTMHFVADFLGYYSYQGVGFKPMTPIRVLDTRTGLGAPTAAPIPAGTTRTLDLSSHLPSGATAAVLNVTATQATRGGWLSVFPDGQPLPLASNLNYVAGRSVANLVMVPVTAGKVDIHNGGAGPVHVVADLDGFFGTDASGATASFVPYGPDRIVDTRGATDGLWFGSTSAHGVLTFLPSTFYVLEPSLPTVSIVANVTVTGPAAGGYLTVYPESANRPTTSNLNFQPHQTVANSTLVGVDSGTNIYNGSSGSVSIVVDEFGYFIPAAS